MLSAIKEDKFLCLKLQLGPKIDDMGLLRWYGRFLNATMAKVQSIRSYFLDEYTLLL